MTFLNAALFKLHTATRLALLVGIRQLPATWNNRTLTECFEGQASPLEAAAFLAVQNMPRLQRRKNIDRKLRRLIHSGYIRKGVLANGYPDPNLLIPVDDQQGSLPFEDLPEPVPEAMETVLSNLDARNSGEADLDILDNVDIDHEEDDYPPAGHAQFFKGMAVGIALAMIVPLAIWLKPQYQTLTGQKPLRYSPQVIKVAAARGQDCARSDDLYSQLFCGELWRKELVAQVERTYIDLLAVSGAVDHMQSETGFRTSEPLAQQVKKTQRLWERHAEARCNTAASVESLGVKRSNLFLQCIHGELLAREKEAREQLNYLRSLGWHEQADDALNNELIAIRNMAASQPDEIEDGQSSQQPAPNTEQPAELQPEP